MRTLAKQDHRTTLRRSLDVALAALLALSTACSKPSANASPEARGRSAPSAEVVRSAALPFGESAHLFVPEGRARDERLAFVLLLHGLGGSGEELVRGLGLRDFAAHERFMFAAPDGTLDRHGRRFWDAGAACCNFELPRIDDVKRLGALIDYALTSLGADPARVFVVGYSNGGFMAHRLACARSGSLKGIVSIAASGPGPSEPCAAETPVNVLELHGDQDSIVALDGGHLFRDDSLPIIPGVRAGFAVWSKRAACEGELGPVAHRDLIDELPGSETRIERFSRCGRAVLELWVVEGGRHTLNLRPRMLDAIWHFLRALPPH